MTTPEKFLDDMREAADIHRRMTEEASPFRDEVFYLLRAITDVEDRIGRIVDWWKADFLLKATAHDRNSPNTGQDYENYSKALIVPTEILRGRGYNDLAHRIYFYAVNATDKYSIEKGVDLHRGALYANLAITYLVRKEYELGLSWLLAAANQDVLFNRVPDVYGSFAMSKDGILGEWVQKNIQPAIPTDVMGFVNTHLGTAYGFDQLMEMLRSLAGQGDLNLFAGIINFEEMKGRTDNVGQSVRFLCLRDLATLFEVLLKRIGNNHNDQAVVTKYRNGPMLAKMLHFMHYQNDPVTAANRHQKTEGIFWNSVQQRGDLLDAILTGFPHTSNRNSNLQAVHAYLMATNLSADNKINAIAKRFLLAHRLRNETSHGFKPSDAGIVAHAEEFRLWMLQANFYLFFWARDAGQAAL